MKFIHFADAHLDSPFRGLSFLPSKAFKQIYEASDQSLIRIVDLALQEKVDLVLIAGDTFDSNRPSPRSQLFFAKEIRRLTDAAIQVVMIFGNHDHMAVDDLLVTPSPYFKLLGPNEEVEKAGFTTKNGFNYDVVGFSYLNNHIMDDKIPAFPAKGDKYTFGIMHAQQKTTTKSQNVYAPFALSDLKQLNYDYFALGHIHLRQVLSEKPWVVYPGNIQSRHINELGAKGCYLGEIDEKTRETKIEFHQTDAILWQAKEIKIDGPINKNDLQAKLLELGEIKQPTYFSLRLSGGENLTDEEMELVQDSDYWQNLSSNLPLASQIVDLRFTSDDQQFVLHSNEQAAFAQAGQEIFAPDEFKKLISDWAKKDPLTETAADNDEFIKEVAALTKVKLNNRLKGISDETETN